MLLLRVNSFTFLVLISVISQVKPSILNLNHLKRLKFNDVHRIAVLDQVENSLTGLRAQKSLGTRSVDSLDGVYDFCLDSGPSGFDKAWFNQSLARVCHEENFYKLPVPSAFNDIVSNKTVRNYVGWFWYQKSIEIDVGQLNLTQKFIQFENVNYMTIVWLKSLQNHETRLLGSHVGGYLPFIFNITDMVTDKLDNNYLLTIAVSNQLTQETIPSGTLIDLSEQVGYKYHKFVPDFDFFHYSGIMGSINLLHLHPILLASVDLQGHDNIAEEPLKFNICIDKYTYNELSREQSLNFKITVTISLPNQSEVIDSASDLYRNQPRSQPAASCYLFELSNGKLLNYTWSPSNGLINHFSRMLKSSIKLELVYDGNETPSTLDIYELTFGVRGKFSINQANYLQGFGMHHEQLFSGRTMHLPAIMKDMYLLKQVGANVIRTSHYPYSEDYLSQCDEHGIYVIAECQAVGLRFAELNSELKLMLHKQLLLEMMQRDHQHPSIIMWSVANEPSSQLNASQAYFGELLAYLRGDPLGVYTRAKLLTAAIAQAHQDDKIGHLLDLIMINRYFAWYDYTAVLEAIRKPLIGSLLGWASKYGASKPLMISEYGADTLAGLHRQLPGDLFSEEYQSSFLLEYEKTFNEIRLNYSDRINFYGSMIWNFADFQTHESLLRPGGNRKGVLTRDREPKLSMNIIRDVYSRRLLPARHAEL